MLGFKERSVYCFRKTYLRICERKLEGDEQYALALSKGKWRLISWEDLDHSRDEDEKTLFCRMYVLGQPEIQMNCWMTVLVNMAFTTPFPDGSDSKKSACNVGDPGLIPGSGISPGEGNGKPLKYSFLENFMDRGAWWATVHGVTKSQTQLNY